MIKLIWISLLSFYISFILLGFFICARNYSKINIKIIQQLILSWFVFFVDFLLFLKIFFKWTIIYIYNIIHDIWLGLNLSDDYTETDLNRPVEEFFEDDDNEHYHDQMDIYDEKDFELFNFETSLFYVRVLQFIRFFYLILFICYEQIWYLYKVYFFNFLRNNLILWFIYFFVWNFFYFIRQLNLKFIIKAYWAFLLRIRTYIFIILHQEYFFIWFYKKYKNYL